ncbi:hypothetical protein BKA82DRAFT_4159845 [Pisolithus tinctorius]|nr:hypothetical protein BKA82DRAFT_4159845 [Pisolithus tinctorius]
MVSCPAANVLWSLRKASLRCWLRGIGYAVPLMLSSTDLTSFAPSNAISAHKRQRHGSRWWATRKLLSTYMLLSGAQEMLLAAMLQVTLHPSFQYQPYSTGTTT